MAEDVDVPKVGPVDKKIVGAIVVAVAGFVAYRYWSASRTASADASTVDATGSEFADTNSDPSAVLGAVSPTNSYGFSDAPAGDSGSNNTVDTYGFHGTTNDQWTQYAATQLGQSDRWSYADVVEALGKYLAQKPTTTAEQAIINAAIAVAGHPPVGTFVLVYAPAPIGPIAPAAVPKPSVMAVPGGLRAMAPTIHKQSFGVQWNAVAGARRYDVDLTPGPVQTATETHETFSHLKANTAYQVRVRAVQPGGATSAWSPYITVRTLK